MHPTSCGCSDDVLQCERCRLAAVDVAAAVAQICDHTRASGANQVEYTDPFTGRVATVRRDEHGCWSVIDVRQMGSVERSRCRPLAGRA